MPEFDLIRRLQETIEVSGEDRGLDCVVGIGDDAAVLNCPAGHQLVVCTDTLVEGVHFPFNTCARSVGYKSLAVNLSDLAAMGAKPAWFFMALTLPEENRSWLDDFADGMAGLAREAGIILAGGDTTTGPLSITITAVGLAEPGTAMTRSGASEGDLVVVSGEPGRAANALRLLKQQQAPDSGDLQALEYPRPRLALGRAIRGIASACIDVSDGLLADLGHILEQSVKGAEIELDAFPPVDSLAGLGMEQRWQLQLAGGDDYELCFTINPAAAGRLDAISQETGVRLSVIGKITASGMILRKPGGGEYSPGAQGYQHFAGSNIEVDG